MSRAKGGHTGVDVQEVPGALFVVDHREVEAGQAWGAGPTAQTHSGTQRFGKTTSNVPFTIFSDGVESVSAGGVKAKSVSVGKEQEQKKKTIWLSTIYLLNTNPKISGSDLLPRPDGTTEPPPPPPPAQQHNKSL